MKLRRVRTGIDFQIRDTYGMSEEEFKRNGARPDIFSMVAIDITSDKEMMPFSIMRWLHAAGFETQVELDLPEHWLVQPCYAARMWLEKDLLVFRAYDHFRGHKDFKVPAKDTWEALGIDEQHREYGEQGFPVPGAEGCFYSLTNCVENALITDRKTFFALVDRYDNNHIDTVWHISEPNESTDFAFVNYITQTRLRSLLPDNLQTALLKDAIQTDWTERRIN